MSKSGPKRLRGRRARLKQRPRARDLRDQYREADLPAAPSIAVFEIEDPYAPAGHIDQREIWILARSCAGSFIPMVLSPRVPPAGLHHRARGSPSFATSRKTRWAGCTLAAKLMARNTSPVAVTKRPTTPRKLDVFAASIGARRRCRAGRWPSLLPTGSARPRRGCAPLRRQCCVVLAKLAWCSGAVLGDRRPLELTARAAGAIGEREIRACGWLLRQCLNVIAKALGIATTTRRKPQRVIEPDDPAVDPARRADAGDLADPQLRSHGNGRANGG